jgi:hypothetical protein
VRSNTEDLVDGRHDEGGRCGASLFLQDLVDLCQRIRHVARTFPGSQITFPPNWGGLPLPYKCLIILTAPAATTESTPMVTPGRDRGGGSDPRSASSQQ